MNLDKVQNKQKSEKGFINSVYLARQLSMTLGLTPLLKMKNMNEKCLNNECQLMRALKIIGQAIMALNNLNCIKPKQSTQMASQTSRGIQLRCKKGTDLS